MTDFEEIFLQIASDMNTTASEVKEKIEEIAKEGLKSASVKDRHFWLQVPKKGAFPTAEEIVLFLSLLAYHSGDAEDIIITQEKTESF